MQGTRGSALHPVPCTAVQGSFRHEVRVRTWYLVPPYSRPSSVSVGPLRKLPKKYVADLIILFAGIVLSGETESAASQNCQLPI